MAAPDSGTHLVMRFAELTGDDATARALIVRYTEPHRRYHTVEHLGEVLDAVDRLAHLADDRVAVELAAWYHDAIYDPAASPGGSERLSADLAVDELTAIGTGLATVDEVHRLVLLTAGHEVASDDRNGAVLADADLGILGAAPDRYARYAADVRAEYTHVTDDAWIAGRSAVLQGFLDRPRLYVTDLAHLAFDRPARRNVAWELATLR